MKSALLKIIDAEVSVPTWILLFISTGIALVMLAYVVTQPTRLEEFTNALPLFDGLLWTALLSISALLTGLFLALKRHKWASYSSFSSFCLWVFGALSFWAIEGQSTVILIVLPLLVFHAYLFLGPVLRDRNGL